VLALAEIEEEWEIPKWKGERWSFQKEKLLREHHRTH